MPKHILVFADNEREGYIIWETWSAWTCKMYGGGLNTTCLMSRTRLCSTGKPADCEGFPYEIKTCMGSDCLGNVTRTVKNNISVLFIVHFYRQCTLN